MRRARSPSFRPASPASSPDAHSRSASYADENGSGDRDSRVVEYQIKTQAFNVYRITAWYDPGPRIRKRTGRRLLSETLEFTEEVTICSLNDKPPDGVFTVTAK